MPYHSLNVSRAKPPKRASVRSSYPFPDMAVGGHFTIKNATFEDYHRLEAAAHGYARRHNMKFSVYKVAGGYCCERID